MWSMLSHAAVSHTKQAFRRGLSLHIYLQFKTKKKNHNISMQPLKTVTLPWRFFERLSLHINIPEVHWKSMYPKYPHNQLPGNRIKKQTFIHCYWIFRPKLYLILEIIQQVTYKDLYITNYCLSELKNSAVKPLVPSLNVAISDLQSVQPHAQKECAKIAEGSSLEWKTHS